MTQSIAKSIFVPEELKEVLQNGLELWGRQCRDEGQKIWKRQAEDVLSRCVATSTPHDQNSSSKNSDDLVWILETAACLWEAFLELARKPEGYGPAMEATRLSWGTSEMRLTIISFSQECDRAYKAASNAGKFDEPFDWEWCPHFLVEHVVWDPDGKKLPTLKTPASS